MNGDDDSYSDEDAARRRDEVIKRMLNTPPQPRPGKKASAASVRVTAEVDPELLALPALVQAVEALNEPVLGILDSPEALSEPWVILDVERRSAGGTDELRVRLKPSSACREVVAAFGARERDRDVNK